MTDSSRPKKYLDFYSRQYPGIWRLVDQFRSVRGKDLPDWPDWCFLPISGLYAIVTYLAGYNTTIDMRDPAQRAVLNDIAVMTALASWRVTQGVYRFDPDTYREVVNTPVIGAIPYQILFQIPEWCVYIETPGLSYFSTPMMGYFAFLEYDVEETRIELRFIIDFGESFVLGHSGPQATALHLGDWSLEESIRSASAESLKQLKKHNWDNREIDITTKEFVDMSVSQFQPLVSLLLYLCSANGEIEPVEGKTPKKPQPKKTKKGPRLFPPDKPTTWDVGIRMGAAIRQAAATSEDRGGNHASPRPHIRRAHWHTYWTGKRDKPEKRKPILKWLSPILVGAEGDLPVTIRPVK